MRYGSGATWGPRRTAQGVNVAFVSRQLGHASITTALNVYTDLFDRAERAASVIAFGATQDIPETVLEPFGFTG